MSQQKALINIEEALRAAGLHSVLNGIQADEATWPERLDRILKSMPDGDSLTTSPKDLTHLLQYLEAEQRMDADLSTVPEALLATVERALEPLGAATQQEGIIVRLLRNGLELVQGSLAGATLELGPVAATRRAGLPEASDTATTGSRLDLKMPAGRGQIHCSILQTSGSEATVCLSLKNLAGSYQLSLKKDDRIVGSHSGVKSNRTVQFDRVGAGSYMVELKGAAQTMIPFSIV